MLQKENEIFKLLPFKSILKTKRKSLTFAKSKEADCWNSLVNWKMELIRMWWIQWRNTKTFNDQLSENIKWKIVPKIMKMNSCISFSSIDEYQKNKFTFYQQRKKIFYLKIIQKLSQNLKSKKKNNNFKNSFSKNFSFSLSEIYNRVFRLNFTFIRC